MKRIIIVYGLVAGFVVSVLMLINMNFLSHCTGGMDYDSSMVMGYASMLIAFSIVFVGIRQYRNTVNGGVINFGTAFKAGLFMVFISSTMYVIAWLFDYYLFMPDFFEKYSQHLLTELRDSGASQSEIESKTKEMADFAIMFKNPFFNAIMVYMEILPVGLIAILISAFILKKKAVSN
jgi:hypothetical protein